MSTEPPPPPPAEDGAAPQNYGNLTTAWMDAGEQVAEMEAGRIAERKRLISVTAIVLLLIGGAVAAVVLL